jgi:hypothetical protein
MQNPMALVKVVADLLPEEKQLTIADPLLDAINRLAASRYSATLAGPTGDVLSAPTQESRGPITRYASGLRMPSFET